MLHIKSVNIFEQRSEKGFTLLEVILVISLVSLLSIGILNLFIESIEFIHNLGQRSETIAQVRTGIEAMVSDLQDADPQTIVLLENIDTVTFTQIQFSKYDSSDLYWFYINSSKKLIRAIKRPNKNWGRTTIATEIEELCFTNNSSFNTLQIILKGGNDKTVFKLITCISPGF